MKRNKTLGPKPIAEIPKTVCKNLHGILTDIDDTLTLDGKLLAPAYNALAQAKQAGLLVVVVTGRPAGWVDHIARMWPVDGVIGENGAFYFHMENGRLKRCFLQSGKTREKNRKRLNKIAGEILRKIPGTALASDQGYRTCDLAIDYCEDVPPLKKNSVKQIVQIFKRHGATCKVSSIHVNGWFGRYDKLFMTQRFLQEVFSVNLKKKQNRFVFFGDSPNDEPLFAFFTHGIGVANISKFLGDMDNKPHWITKKPGSGGFREGISGILRKKLAKIPR